MINVQILFLVIVNLKYYVCYIRETLLGKHAKPNQPTQYVFYDRVFVITMIVITEFDCICRAVLIPVGALILYICRSQKFLKNLNP